MKNSILKTLLLYKLFFLLFIGIHCTYVYAEKIRNLTTIEGVRENQLIGYGLVVGLNGTGDHVSQVPFTFHTLHNMLSQLGIKVPISNSTELNNIASVIVTAKLPPFGKPGEKIDVIVSSIGNARSLKGGILLMTPLKGVDNQIYAMSQGNIITNKKYHALKNNILYSTINEHNTGKIFCGAIIEKEVTNNLEKLKSINLQLNQENFDLSRKIADNINAHYPKIATAINSKIVHVVVNSLQKNTQVSLISKIQNIDIPISKLEIAKIIINSHTGSIVINKSVKLQPCTITYKNFSILIHSDNNINLSQSITVSKKIMGCRKQNKLVNKQITLSNVVHSLNLLGIKPIELISILKSMNAAACIKTKLEIL
ncbi:flagellar basal body P-ring protein FlgI [Buchnera aphidicola (Hormaphis cornu)]|nr:flagellar basal body P-ring protein FlgI [Buchnera aphidicola (Hormaphis cornu)]